MLTHAVAFGTFVMASGFGGMSSLHFPSRRYPPSSSHMDGRLGEQPTNDGDALSTPLDLIVQTAIVDYSAANDYIRAHYGNMTSKYFDTTGFNGSLLTVFHDGRTKQSCYSDERAMLNDNGLAIIESTLKREPNWSDIEDVQHSYLPELERIIQQLFPSESLMRYCFWNPIVRGETLDISREVGETKTPTANVAPLVHIDTDVGAYNTIQEILDIVEKNKVQSSLPHGAKYGLGHIKGLADEIVNGRKRFVILNFWRNIGHTPVSSAPLGILSTRYDNPQSAFPDRPNMEDSKWYIFPNATRDEVIVFYQYDRNVEQPSDLWHSAVSAGNNKVEEMQNNQLSSPRRSFDIRVFIVLEECVPKHLDRFSPDRIKPVLSFEESGCFCDEQAAIRNQDK